MNEHGPLARAALRPASTCSSRSPWPPLWRKPRPCSSSRRNRPGTSSARRTSCSPRPIAPCTRTSRTATSGACCWRGRATAGRARTGARWFYERGGGALFDLGVYNVTALCGLFGPAQRVTAMAGVAIGERVVEGEAIQRRGRGQRARADRLRRGALRVGHDRVHDAALPLTGDRAVWRRRRAAAARRRLGAGGLRALAQCEGRLGAVPRERPGLAMDRRSAAPRRVHRGRPRARDPARACLSRARDHAGGAGGGRRRSNEGDRAATSRAPSSRNSRTRRTAAASTTRAPR